MDSCIKIRPNRQQHLRIGVERWIHSDGNIGPFLSLGMEDDGMETKDAKLPASMIEVTVVHADIPQQYKNGAPT